jgi:hypothetical protein
MPAPDLSGRHDQTDRRKTNRPIIGRHPGGPMDNQDLTQMPPTGEDQDDAGPEIDGWSAFWAVLLGVGFVIHMTFAGIGDGPTLGMYGRLRLCFFVLGGVAVTGMALAGLTRMKQPKPKPPAAQDRLGARGRLAVGSSDVATHRGPGGADGGRELSRSATNLLESR